MQGWQVWVARSHLFPFPILNLRLTAAIKHPSCSPADGNDSTVGENDLLMAAGLPPFRAGGSRSRLETPLPRRGVSTPQRIGKALIGGSASAPQSCSPFRKPGKSDLLFHHQGGEERGKKKKKGKAKKRQRGCTGNGPGCWLSSWQPTKHVRGPDWKTKGLEPRSSGKSAGTVQMRQGTDTSPQR